MNEDEARTLRNRSNTILTSPPQEKLNDWATLGGIANGIAGPAAGVATAVNAMAENERIKERNAMYLNCAAYLSGEVGKKAKQAEDEVASLRNNANLVRAEIKALDEKVVLAVTSEELEESLKCVSFDVKKSKSDILEITASISNNYVPDVPKGVKIIIDGVIVADVLCEGVRIDEVYLPLPLYGIKCGITDEVYGYCATYMVGDREYTISVRSMNVWAMEL